jgi:ATP-binding cassette subfamily B protein
MKKIRYKQTFYSCIFVALGVIGSGVCFWWVIEQALKGEFTAGDILLFSSTILITSQSLINVVEESSLLYDTLLYMKKFFNFLGIESKISSGDIALNLHDSNFDIEFKNVSFSYPKSKNLVLNNVNFSVKNGEKVALVGENGAGKTTIVKLLSRLYEVSSGEIFLKNKNINIYDINSLRQNYSVVFQDFAKFQLTIRENIGFGDLNMLNNDDVIAKIITSSGLQNVIERLPKGLDNMVGKNFEGGTEFSGGEWQKIAIARAMLRQAPLLILDEPTASLDARSEYEIFEKFVEMSKGKTVFLITHRLSTVKIADKVLVLKNGEIVETGNHYDLIKSNGYYAELYKMQAEKYS